MAFIGFSRQAFRIFFETLDNRRSTPHGCPIQDARFVALKVAIAT